MQTISQVDASESPLDIKCGLMRSISQVQTTDGLFDVKLALSSFAVRNKSRILDTKEDSLTVDFVERAQFRLWASVRNPGEKSDGSL